MNQAHDLAAATAAFLFIALAHPAAASAQEGYQVSGEHVAVFNLAGQLQVAATGGSAVTVAVTRAGADADQLEIRTGDVGGRQTLRVVYPSDRVHYDPDGWNGSTTLRVRRDGTWGDRDRGGERVRISTRPGGLDAHADLTVGIPRGQRVDIYLGVGRITAENVDGDLRLDTSAGAVSASDMSGRLVIDTGSGSVDVDGMAGDLDVDTGSGGVRVVGVTADALRIDTGSGSVDARDVASRSLEIDTGSGGITLLSATASDLALDTGSGSVEAELTKDVDRLVVDTGSGSVVLRLAQDVGARLHVETGSGGIHVDVPLTITHHARDELDGTIGDGRGSIEIDTGSGSVRIRGM